MKRFYLAGPISGPFEKENKEYFHSVTKILRDKGYTIENPVESDHLITDDNWVSYMKKDIKLIADCDGLILLPKWSSSKGAILEQRICFDMEYPIHVFDEWLEDIKFLMERK